MATALQQHERSDLASREANTLELSVESDPRGQRKGGNIVLLYCGPTVIDSITSPDALPFCGPEYGSRLTGPSGHQGAFGYTGMPEYQIGCAGDSTTLLNVGVLGNVGSVVHPGVSPIHGNVTTSGYLGTSGNVVVSQDIAMSGAIAATELKYESIDFVVRVSPGRIVLGEAKSDPNVKHRQLAFGQTRGGISTQSSDHQITLVVDRILSSSGAAKHDAQESAATLFARTGGSVGVLDKIVRSLVFSRRSGAIDDAIDVLALVTREAVRLLARSASHRFTQESTDDNYWYAVIRGAGRLGDRETITQFFNSTNFSIQEAVVEALSDLGDSMALRDLKRIADDSARPESIRSLALELTTDIA